MCRLPYLFLAFTGRLPLQLHKLHKKYGPIVRTAPNELSFIDPSAWKTIHGQHAGRHTAFRKNYVSVNRMRNEFGESIFISDDDEHTRMRKILNCAFSPQALRDQEPLIQKHVQQFMEGVDAERASNHGTVESTKWYMWLAFDVIADAAFGEPFKCLLEPTNRQWPLLLSKTWKIVIYSSELLKITPAFLCRIFPTRFVQTEVNKLDLILDRVKSRLTSKPHRGDLISSIVEHNEKKGSLTQTEIISNASLFVLAGTETVATALPGLTYLLTKNPRAMSKVTKEIRQRFLHESAMTIHELNQMRYLTACIEEALRLFPPVADGLPRIAPSEGHIICGEWVPGGVSTLLGNDTCIQELRLTAFIDCRDDQPFRSQPIRIKLHGSRVLRT